MLMVTGGGGFAMSHVVRQWLERDRAARVLLIDASPLDGPASAFFAAHSDRIDVVTGDVGDSALWEHIARAGGPLSQVTHIVHGAAVTSIEAQRQREGFGAALAVLEANVIGTARMLAAAEQSPRLQRVVNVSSSSVYANRGLQAPDQPLAEDVSVHPSGLYAISKLTGELLANDAALGSGVPVVSVRPSSVYGPLDRRTATRAVDCVPKRLLHLHRQGRTVRVSGLGSVGDYIHAGELARAIIALLDAPALRHPVYNIALGEFVTLERLLALVGSVRPAFRYTLVDPSNADIAGDPCHVDGKWGALDISRLVADSGWRPRPLVEMLADYADWLDHHEV
ncbi:MAG: NAD-dependent epimerase/dehydratase family protein [Rhizobiales bacterium]|nr:NAD-dependent epimerase/dehydratase family protein [Hyphomicrobiales bacterium]